MQNNIFHLFKRKKSQSVFVSLLNQIKEGVIESTKYDR